MIPSILNIGKEASPNAWVTQIKGRKHKVKGNPGWGDGSAMKSPPHKHEDLGSDPQYLHKA